MKIQFGKHAGTPAELVVLKDPDYALWLLSVEGARGSFRASQREISRLIRLFNESARPKRIGSRYGSHVREIPRVKWRHHKC